MTEPTLQTFERAGDTARVEVVGYGLTPEASKIVLDYLRVRAPLIDALSDLERLEYNRFVNGKLQRIMQTYILGGLESKPLGMNPLEHAIKWVNGKDEYTQQEKRFLTFALMDDFLVHLRYSSDNPELLAEKPHDILPIIRVDEQ